MRTPLWSGITFRLEIIQQSWQNIVSIVSFGAFKGLLFFIRESISVQLTSSLTSFASVKIDNRFICLVESKPVKLEVIPLLHKVWPIALFVSSLVNFTLTKEY